MTNATQLSSDFGQIITLSPTQIATARANVAAHARDEQDAELLCDELGLVP